MKKPANWHFIAAAVVAWAGITGAALADDDGERECSAATLRGLYVFSATGYNIVGGVAQPKAILEAIRFDGEGGLTVLAATVSLNGAIVHPPPNGTGTYTVGPNCAGTLTFAPSGPTFDLFLAPRGAPLFMIQTTPNTVLQGTVVKVSS
jgi:hypothetical protein